MGQQRRINRNVVVWCASEEIARHLEGEEVQLYLGGRHSSTRNQPWDHTRAQDLSDGYQTPAVPKFISQGDIIIKAIAHRPSFHTSKIEQQRFYLEIFKLEIFPHPPHPQDAGFCTASSLVSGVSHCVSCEAVRCGGHLCQGLPAIRGIYGISQACPHNGSFQTKARLPSDSQGSRSVHHSLAFTFKHPRMVRTFFTYDC